MVSRKQMSAQNLYNILLCVILFFLLWPMAGYAQQKSPHIEQQELARKGYFISQFNTPETNLHRQDSYFENHNQLCSLNKLVFGYHPSWVGNAYLYYNWNLLSDLCYFSYEVAPSTGMPITTNEWETAAVIDSAQAHGVRVHLCVTLFKGHATFFNSETSQQTLINQIIEKMRLRNALGVNIDVEALPASLAAKYNTFLVQLATQVHDSIAGSIVSIAAPAVDWNNELDIPMIKDHIDLFMVMTYDYYWSGSSQAGPVSPLYPMTQDYSYGVARSLSWYIAKGIPLSKILAGVPYYGREWPVESPSAPSNTTGSASAITYRTTQNNPGIYNSDNFRWESNSKSPYYSYFVDRWWQCFVDNEYSLGLKYDLVNMLNIGGIGIWALGYDKGYDNLWEKIFEKFTNCQAYTCTDTIYDNGGPSNNYYNNEDYVLTVSSDSNEKIRLDFNAFDLENGYDFLSVYDGADTNTNLIGKYTGNQIPTSFSGTSNSITLKFHSDGQTTSSGWMAIRKCPTAGIAAKKTQNQILKIEPNPASVYDRVQIYTKGKTIQKVIVRDLKGNTLSCDMDVISPEKITLSHIQPYSSGIYIIEIVYNDGSLSFGKLILL